MSSETESYYSESGNSVDALLYEQDEIINDLREKIKELEQHTKEQEEYTVELEKRVENLHNILKANLAHYLNTITDYL
jgi:hypothetical protein